VPLRGVELAWEPVSPAAVHVAPVRTVAQGEDGYHLSYQGHLLMFAWDVTAAPGETVELGLRWRLERREETA